ncbi:hypothetical protein BDN70DRAFT_997913 [Pholiota conissans]|uniref:BTB domain-containing protein n=1 Tax=Pholiota conissans TaxID=109636 RepID=A0A9P6CTE0_9AGAR|nr:hypothetical protein BDN70DRAFT_997913 [Pholiota conissans]
MAAPSTPPSSAPKISESSIFNSPTGDVTFISSDLVLFKLHSTHLNVNSMGFANFSENTIVGKELVPLAEHSTILDVLFQFIEPPPESREFRQPLVGSLKPELLFKLAEAAEKYIVYAAMNVCITRMQQLVKEYPLEALNHSAMHGYRDLADEAAKNSLLRPLDQVAIKLTGPGVIQRYLIYLSKYQEPAKKAISRFEGILLDPMQCPVWIYAYAKYRQQVDRSLLSIDIRPEIPEEDSDLTTCTNEMCQCKDLYLELRWPRFLEKYSNLPPVVPTFSTITI